MMLSESRYGQNRKTNHTDISDTGPMKTSAAARKQKKKLKRIADNVFSKFLSLAALFLACLRHGSVNAEEKPRHQQERRKKSAGRWWAES